MTEDRDSIVPRDEFSVQRRKLEANPAAVAASSRVDVEDFYGRLETWTIDTYRADGESTVFLQRMTPEGSLRIVLPPDITACIDRQAERVISQTRTRAANQAVATRRLRGDRIGNPEALRKARRKK